MFNEYPLCFTCTDERCTRNKTKLYHDTLTSLHKTLSEIIDENTVGHLYSLTQEEAFELDVNLRTMLGIITGVLNETSEEHNWFRNKF